jgi:hypothetical protein
MSKWFNAHSRRLADSKELGMGLEDFALLFGTRLKRVGAALMLGAMLAACSPSDEQKAQDRVNTSTIVEPETIGIDSVPEEEPAVARGTWRAAGESARTNTGNLRVSLEGSRGGPVIFAFATGVTIRAQPISVSPADARSGVSAESFAALLGGDPRVQVYLYRVLDENVATNIRQGGLCGANPTRHLVASEFVDAGGRWTFRLAAFRSERPPGVSGDDPLVCGAFAYLAPGS